ncbi:hypothetical protein LTR56_006400 [Elasticomyces elasticus]|nr:hypothetical protein LTR56_006400 [Elasticomyces elasticus]KAK3662021.1 hypothetical protein LTR22_007192 [Elasticomyces elasticus]KAK4933188.1 hypothetical protein LTR49_000672 [Elasticomyces elasticus]KAK5756818.1 hypothetical protein LTS12_013019 [Elasticomyces elasticus]
MAGSSREASIVVSTEADDEVPQSIDLTDDDDDDERQIQRDLTTGELADYERLTRPAGYVECDFASSPICGRITQGCRIERKDGDFLLVKYVMQAPTGEKYLQGILMQRNHRIMRKLGRAHWLHAVLPLQKNELCMVLKTSENSLGCSLDDSCLVTMPVSDAVSIRDVIISNYDFPSFSYLEHGLSVYTHTREVIEEEANLVCRWKYTEEVNIKAKKATAFQLAPLDEAECDPQRGLPNVLRFRKFRGVESEHKYDTTGRKVYISADLFSGGGGTVTGMVKAGLDVKYVLDNMPQACQTLQMNWPNVVVIKMDITDFIKAIADAHTGGDIVDVLHVSFPCQAHSYRNKGTNEERDAIGVALGYSLKNILEKIKPRVVTVEQTNGILTKNEGQHFRPLLQALTTTGYAVRWGVLNLAKYGNPQQRKRLIVVGSCSGELLPPYPEPTHGPGQQLPFTTINDWISGLTKRSIRDKMGDGANLRNESPYDGRMQLKGLVTGDGGTSNLHPNGCRTFALRELARLQTFPMNYKFAGGITAIKMQIGNAVPPVFARALFKEIAKSLERSDAEMAAWEPEEIDLTDD